MIAVNIICIGTLKEKYLIDAAKEYQKRISKTYKLSIVELNESKLSQNPSQKEIEKALENEAKAIVKKIPANSFVLAMCIEGRQIGSEELSRKIDILAANGCGSVCFIIGSSFGLSEEVKKRADFALSMSKMTFPHQLARVMLLEQIYRSGQISIGSKYHK